MSFISEFKEFAVKGNVMDMAVGVIIGAAFGKIVNSAVNDLVMPVIGKLVGGVDFSNLYVNLGEGTFASLAEDGRLSGITGFFHPDAAPAPVPA